MGPGFGLSVMGWLGWCESLLKPAFLSASTKTTKAYVEQFVYIHIRELAVTTTATVAYDALSPEARKHYTVMKSGETKIKTTPEGRRVVPEKL